MRAQYLSRVITQSASASRGLRLLRPTRTLSSSSSLRRDVLSELEDQIAPRELVERKRKEFEAKYGDKLKKRIEAEGVDTLDALKEKVVAPSVLAKLKAKEYREAELAKQAADRVKQEAELAAKQAGGGQDPVKKPVKRSPTSSQAEGDRSGVKPLGSIINLPLIHMTPHDARAIGDIWTAYHTTHPTLSASFLSASLPASTYESILSLARANPFFVLPLPRDGPEAAKTGEAFEMFYLQWLFHPPPTAPPSTDLNPAPLPPVTSVIFTPLEEFKQAGEWAQPYLVLTHYPDLANTHGLVLMRGEISAQSASGPAGSESNPGFLLAQQQAQLLALGLQRFYCADLAVPGEDAAARQDRQRRSQALRDFREKPHEWDWQGLVAMAFAGLA